MTSKSKWTIVVETNRYAGNFERMLCAYVTGRCGENARHLAPPYLEMFKKEMGVAEDAEEEDWPFADLVEERVVDLNDNPFQNFCEICGKDRMSVRIFLERQPTKEEWDTLVARAHAFPAVSNKAKFLPQKRLKIAKVRLVKTTTTTEDEDVVL